MCCLLQMVLDLGYEVLWSDMDAVWLKNFFSLAPQGLDYVGVDDSETENEQVTPPLHYCPLHATICIQDLLATQLGAFTKGVSAECLNGTCRSSCP